MSLRTCEFCGYERLYDAALHCLKCKSEWEPCMLTGYPLVKESYVTCNTCGKGALQMHMAQYFDITKKCPWCTQKSMIHVNIGNTRVDANPV